MHPRPVEEVDALFAGGDALGHLPGCVVVQGSTRAGEGDERALEEDIYHGEDTGGRRAAYVAVAGDTGERREGIHQASDVGGGGVVTHPTEQVPYGALREPGEDGNVEERAEAGKVRGFRELAYARG
jgi:hypothetical protein